MAKIGPPVCCAFFSNDCFLEDFWKQLYCVGLPEGVEFALEPKRMDII